MSPTFRQAITTEYKGPTNSRGGRILVKAQAGRMTVPWDHALDTAANHAAAALAFARRWGWVGPDASPLTDGMAGGALPNGRGYCFVILDKWAKVA